MRHEKNPPDSSCCSGFRCYYNIKSIMVEKLKMPGKILSLLRSVSKRGNTAQDQIERIVIMKKPHHHAHTHRIINYSEPEAGARERLLADVPMNTCCFSEGEAHNTLILPDIRANYPPGSPPAVQVVLLDDRGSRCEDQDHDDQDPCVDERGINTVAGYCRVEQVDKVREGREQVCPRPVPQLA